MTVEGDDLRELLSAAGLGPARLRPRPPLPDGTVAWVLSTSPADWFDEWRTLRDLVEVTGRWPVAVSGWRDLDELNRHGAGRIGAPGRGVGAVVDRAADLDVDARLDAEEAQTEPVDLAEWYELDLGPTTERCGRAPSLEELRAALGDEPGELALEGWVLAWEERHTTGPAPTDCRAGYLAWFEPGEGVELVLLPRPEPWLVPAYISTFSAIYAAPELQVALFRRWHERYGAEPVACWGTMQQLVVARPPGTLPEAWEVARAMRLLWPDTTVLPGVTIREHARDLVGLERWFLHLRP